MAHKGIGYDDKDDRKGKPPGGDSELAEMEAQGRPLIDAVNRMMTDVGGETTVEDEGEPPVPGEEGAVPGTDIAPLVEALDVTPEHAQALYDIAMQTPGYEEMDAQALADKLASDDQARADLERRVAASEGQPEEAAEEEAGMAKVGDATDSGTAVWPGAPSAGSEKKAQPSESEEGIAPWPGG